MKRASKLIALLLVLVMVLALPALAEYPQATGTLAEDYSGKTVILHSNDVHGAIAGYAYAAQLKKDLEARGAEVILVDAGDYSQGTPEVSFYKGATAITMMNAAGYDVATLGNHEFDYGYAQLMENLLEADFKVICANIQMNGEPILDGYTVIEKGGVKIGFFGLDTPEAQTKTNPALITGMTVLNNTNGKTDLYDCAAAQVAALKAAGADLVVGLWHLGVDAESAADGHRSVDVLAKTAGIDLVIDGHSHTVMTAGENGETIQSTGTKFANIGVIVVDNASKAIEANFLLPTEGLAKDEAVTALAEGITAEVNKELDTVFAVSEVELNGAKAPKGNRDSETNNGDLITEAMRWTVMKEGGLAVPEQNVVAITNGGGIRAAIKVGDVTKKDINTVLPFGNTVVVVYISGAELLEALEASTYSLPIGGYPQTTGIEWTLNTTKVYNANPETYPNSTYYGPATIERVSIQSVNGAAFDPAATYAVVTNDFCAAGGDTYHAFKAATSQFDTGIPMDEAVMDYIKTVLNGVIGTAYAAPRGDLKVIDIGNTRIMPTLQRFIIDGVECSAEVYSINDENYFKLRDIAALLSGTEAQFEVVYDQATDAIALETGKAYTPVGGELAAHADRSASIVVSPQTLTVDGVEAHLTAFNLEGNNFFRLSDLSRVLGFACEYDFETNTVTLTTAKQAA